MVAELEEVERDVKDEELDEYLDSLTAIDRIKNSIGALSSDIDRRLYSSRVGKYFAEYWLPNILSDDARKIALKMRARYADLGINKRAKFSLSGQRFQKRTSKSQDIILVNFQDIQAFIDRYLYQLDLRRLAAHADKYTEPKMLQSLSASLELPVSSVFDPVHPLQKWISIGKSVAEKLYLADFITDSTGRKLRDYYHETKRGKFMLPMGIIIGMGSEMLWGDIDDYPHLIYAGITRYGKSAAVATLTMWYCALYDPAINKLVVCDPKQGSSFAVFTDAPHNMFSDIARDFADFGVQIGAVCEEIDHRFEVFRAAKVDNINSYNILMREQSKQEMGRVLVVIDEFTTELSLVDAGTAKRVAEKVHYTQARGAGAGVHAVVMSQDIGADFMSIKHKANVALVLTTKSANVHRSRASIGVPGAERISQKGHFITRYDGQLYNLMSPFAAVRADKKSERNLALPYLMQLVKEKWQAAATGRKIDVKTLQQQDERNTMEQLLLFALNEHEGQFSLKKMGPQIASHLNISTHGLRVIATNLETEELLTPAAPGKVRHVAAKSVTELQNLLDKVYPLTSRKGESALGESALGESQEQKFPQNNPPVPDSPPMEK